MSRLVKSAIAGLALLSAGCELPPQDTGQIGYRGVAMETIQSPEARAELEKANQVPAATPPAPAVGPLASEIYQNVQVLGDLHVPQFTRLMTAITAWVSPEQGCAYCHNLENLASDELYTKVVSRRMIQMTQYVNAEATAHVGATGVTCYTCHRGNNVPQYIWFEQADDTAGRMVGRLAGQNSPAEATRLASLPSDPFTGQLEDPGLLRVLSDTALPTGNTKTTPDLEKVYALMMHFSGALGVNCSYCHNSRAFSSWEQSPPARATAWHGLQMVRHLNTEYLSPLETVYPEYRLGNDYGDAPKGNCQTCHQGVNKPLYGVSMVGDYPSLQKP